MLGPVVDDPVGGLLDFWFGPTAEGLADDAHRNRWYAVEAEFDRACAGFKPLLDDLREGRLDGWLGAPRSHLAYILLTDQLPRNIFRGTAEAFDYDRFALDAARAGVTAGLDVSLGVDERCFFYLPFEHSPRPRSAHPSRVQPCGRPVRCLCRRSWNFGR